MQSKFIISIIVILFVISCNKQVYNEFYFDKNFFKNKIPPGVIVTIPDYNINPVSGTVSHHGLVSPVINEWFLYLKKIKQVDTFIIICPKHYNYSDAQIGMSDIPWHSQKGTIKINKKYSEFLINKLNIKKDNYALFKEHGISTLLPFIQKYYPDATIVPVAMDENNKSLNQCGILGESIADIIKKDKKVFLIISVDFSHRVNIKLTDKRDRASISVMESLDNKKVNFIYSDNNVGLITLFTALKKIDTKNNYLFCHTNSNFFGNDNPADITSYFFTFQY